MSRQNEERRRRIEKLIGEEGELSVDMLAQRFYVSKETIRKDLQFLEDKGIVIRSHGGARSRTANIDLPLSIRNQENIMEKRMIGYRAAEFVRDDDVLYLDSSSTAMCAAMYLKGKKNLSIVTNAIELLTLLEQGKHKVTLPGGDYNAAGKRVSGHKALPLLDAMYFDICIFGMDGCFGIDGPANMLEDELIMNQHVLARTKKKILVSDTSKFQKEAHYQYGRFSQFDILITGKLTEEQKEQIMIPEIIEVL